MAEGHVLVALNGLKEYSWLERRRRRGEQRRREEGRNEKRKGGGGFDQKTLYI